MAVSQNPLPLMNTRFVGNISDHNIELHHLRYSLHTYIHLVGIITVLRAGLVGTLSFKVHAYHTYTYIIGHYNPTVKKKFFRRFPLSRFLAKTLRVNKIAMKSFLKISVAQSRL